jgi:hypothetical protein
MVDQDKEQTYQMDPFEHAKKNPMYLYLIVLAICSTMGLQAWRTLFNNFAVEAAGLNGQHVGMIQSGTSGRLCDPADQRTPSFGPVDSVAGSRDRRHRPVSFLHGAASNHSGNEFRLSLL